MKICRRETFNAAHRLNNPEWSAEKNELVFGKCNNLNYHGHNYVIETWLDGPVDPETGYVYDLKLLKELIQSEISERFDHRNLNLDCPEFTHLQTSAENIAIVSWNLLRAKIDQKYSLTVRLWETENNVVEYSGI